MLTREGCLGRQRRLCERLVAQKIGAAVVTDPRDVYYLTGALPTENPVCLYLEASGRSWLATFTRENEPAVDDVVTYEPSLLYTRNPDPTRRLVDVVKRRLTGQSSGARLGYQEESTTHLLAEAFDAGLHPSAWLPVDETLQEVERRKDPDEIALLRKAAACSLAAYAAAARVIAPGVTELEVLETAHRAATLEAGEVISYNGDYRAGEFGGFARNRPIEAGELYIIDAWTTYRGYWSDLARTFAVGKPTDLQASVHAHIAAILAEVPRQVHVGGSTSTLWRWIDSQIREHPHLRDTGLIHHGGHGVGVRSHEPPDLNRDRGGTFEVGCVFSCEPGAYSHELRAGVRLEHTFLLTETGVETLSPSPITLSAGGEE